MSVSITITCIVHVMCWVANYYLSLWSTDHGVNANKSTAIDSVKTRQVTVLFKFEKNDFLKFISLQVTAY